MQIKRWLLRLRLSGVFVCVLPFIYYTSFGTNLYCSVRGYVYYDKYEVSSLTRSDLCTTIYHRSEGNKIVLWNDVYWVLISLPDSVEGHVSFWYKWGSDKAYINGVSYNVEWGYILRG